MDGLKFAMREVELLIRYVRRHPEVTDILITGGDPLIMKSRILASYIEPLLAAEIPNLRTIPIRKQRPWVSGPYRYLTDPDANELLGLFRKIVQAGKNLAFMSHFSHPQELMTDAAREAIFRIQDTGAQIRTQSPILGNINDRAETLDRDVEGAGKSRLHSILHVRGFGIRGPNIISESHWKGPGEFSGRPTRG